MKLQHCLGGLEGLGPVTFDKRVFAEPWEKRMFGINLALLGLSEHLSEATPQYPIENIPTTFKRKYTAAHLRKRVEAMHPFDYFRYRYYEKWLASAGDFLIAEGYISQQELEARTTACLNHEDLLTQVRRNEAIDKQVIDFLRGGDSAYRDARKNPRFSTGDSVWVKDVKPVEHTRLPGYLRAKTGVVETVYDGCYAYPVSTGPDGLGEPMPVYLVRFDPRDIWGEISEANSLVYAGIYENYLQSI